MAGGHFVLHAATVAAGAAVAFADHVACCAELAAAGVGVDLGSARGFVVRTAAVVEGGPVEGRVALYWSFTGRMWRGLGR